MIIFKSQKRKNFYLIDIDSLLVQIIIFEFGNVNKKCKSITQLVITVFILTIGFMSPISRQLSLFPRSMGIIDLTLINLSALLISKKYHFEELFEIIPNQNSKIRGHTSTNIPNSDAS